jgi:excinuclease UvrABC helicase subunit UvrB
LQELESYRDKLRQQMLEAADNLEFEKAAAIRDQMIDIERKIDVLKKKKK